jgi:hypothetical protein
VIFTLLLAAGAAGVAILRGGSLDSLAATKFRWAWLLAAGLGSQIGLELWSPSWADGGWGVVVLLASNALVAAFLAANARLPGIGLAALGMVMNVVVIAVNGAMPVSEKALERAGFEGRVEEFGVKHELLDDDTNLPWLADVIPVPGRTIISLGDVVLALGIAQLVYRRTRGSTGGKHLVQRTTRYSGKHRT